MAQNDNINERKQSLEEKFSKRFERQIIQGRECFRTSDETIFVLSKFPGKDALVIEYAENNNEALLNRFEDGNQFYMEDMDEETMFQSMLREIEL